MKQIFLLFGAMFLIGKVVGKDIQIKVNEKIQSTIDHVVKSPDMGFFVEMKSDNQFFEKYFDLGEIDIIRYTGAIRNKSCWMVPSTDTIISKLPSETQFLLLEINPQKYVMAIPLIDNIVRSSLSGRADNHLVLVAETGDTLSMGKDFLGLYLLSGTDPYQMIRQASEDIAQRLGSFKLQKEKTVPWFVNHFGWCTYNALYGNLNADTIRYAMQNFKEKKIPVQYILMDVGWQKAKGRQLTGYEADPIKFPNGLAPMIEELKRDFGIQKFLAWQTLWGFWQGIDNESFPELARPTKFLPPPRMGWMLEKSDRFLEQEATVGPNYYPGFLGEDLYVPKFQEYYFNYFDYLRRQGVDGIKIDAITWIEAVGNGYGGRLKMMKEMMDGLQMASAVQFNNELINCSSCSNDYLFNTITSNVTRSSGDFFPDVPESHGFHIFTNAHTSFWMGEIVLPDWDMFQSGHVSGAFHAAARAISGGPVYSTEEIGTENPEVLMKLMTSEGVIPRCREPGRICRESLFIDPRRDKKPIKIFNTNAVGGVVGAFNCSYAEDSEIVVRGEVKITDLEGRSEKEWVVYSNSNDLLKKGTQSTVVQLELGQLQYELVTMVPVKNDFAPVGITDKYNPGGMISAMNWLSERLVSIDLLDGGLFLAYSEKKPKSVLVNGKASNFSYELKNGRLEIQMNTGAPVQMVLSY